MIPPQEEEVFWIFDLVREQEAHDLQRLLPTIHVVPEEQVIGLYGGKRRTKGKSGRKRQKQSARRTEELEVISDIYSG